MTTTTEKSNDKMIIDVTPAAASEVGRLMGLEKQADLYLRLGVTSGGCSGMSYMMEFDSEKGQFDREFDFHGVKVIVDLKALQYLAGTVLDYKSSLTDGGFSFENPNAKRSCGCGSSFTC